MATSKILKKRGNRIWLTIIILLVCALISIYYATLPQNTNLNFIVFQLNIDNSRFIIVSITIISGLIASFLLSFFAADVHESIKGENTDKKQDQPVVQPIENKIFITQPIETRQTAAPVPSISQKFLPTPFLPDLKFFVGREDILQKIKDTLAKDHKAAIHDISGLGKTFTTYKYAEENQEAYKKIFLVRATKEEMLESLAKCGEAVNPDLVKVQEQKAKADGFKQWLEENDKWLVIYDNVDLPGELLPFVPMLLKGDCLFTSNFYDVEDLGTIIDIAKFDKPDAEILLYSRYINKRHSIPDLSGEEKEAFDKIIAEIDGLPLTLNSTGTFVRRKQWKFKRLWREYEETPEVAWESEINKTVYQHRSAGKVFSLVYDELCATKTIGKAVKALLNAMTFLSPDEIPEDLLQEILRNQDKSFKKIKDFDNFWDDVRSTITGYDLLKYNINKEFFTTHRSIQRVIQTKIKPAEKKMICEKLVALFLELFPLYDYFNKEICEKYYQHAQTLLENTDKLQIETENITNLYHRISRYQYLLGNYSQAEMFHRRTLEICVKIFGTDSVEYATILSDLALVCHLQYKSDEAVNKYEEVIEIYKKKLGNAHEWLAAALNNLGNVYQSQGKYDEAIKKYEEVLPIVEKTVGKAHPHYATVLNNLGSVYQEQGRYDEAIEKHLEALKIREKTFGQEHPDYAQSLNNLAFALNAQGRYEEALPMFEEALQIRIKVLGEDHPDTQAGKRNLEACREKIQSK